MDTITPSLRLAEVYESTLSLFYSEELNSTAPAGAAFTVQVGGGAGANPAAVSVEGSVVKLTLATLVPRDQAVTVSYAIPNSDPIRDLSGKEAAGFTGQVAEPASDLYGFRSTPGDRQVMLEWDDTDDDTHRQVPVPLPERIRQPPGTRIGPTFPTATRVPRRLR